jgi:hypothetical protein
MENLRYGDSASNSSVVLDTTDGLKNGARGMMCLLPQISVKKDVNTGCCMAFADTRNITPTMGVMLLHGR